ncbi:MAG: hypothetical protein AAB397_01125 [Patescibacteria group bacterium]
MVKLKQLPRLIIIIFFYCLCIAPIASRDISASDQQEKFFYNPLPNKMLEQLTKIVKNTSFVLKNYFICDEIDNTQYIKSEHKIKLSGEQLIYITSTIESLNKSIEYHSDLWRNNKNIAPIDREKRYDNIYRNMNELENYRATIEEMLGTLFEPVINFDFSDYNNNSRDQNEDTFINHLFTLKNRLKELQDDLMATYAITHMFYNGETILREFENKGFILEGNIENFFEQSQATKKLKLIKKDGTPFTNEEMANLTPDNFKNADQMNVPAVKWFPLSFNGLEFIGCVFRDIPNIERSDGFEKIIELYFLGPIDNPIEEIIFDQTTNKLPMEIRWIDDAGNKHIIWHPYRIYPTDFFPPVSNSLY